MRRAGGGVPDLHNITCVSLPLQGRGMGPGVGEVGSSLAPWGDAETGPPVDPLYRPEMEALQDLRACGCQDRAAEPQTAKWSPLWPPHFPALSCAVSGTLQALLCPQGVGVPNEGPQCGFSRGLCWGRTASSLASGVLGSAAGL